MIPTLKSEFKKLLTVRSTYLLVSVIVLLTALFSYFGTSPIVNEEVKMPPASEQQPAEAQPIAPEDIVITVSRDLPKEKLLLNMQEGIPVVSIIIAISVVLMMGHEFRYNTIAYTLTASNRRSKVLASKILVAIAFTVAAVLIAAASITIATYTAVSIKDLNLPAQDLDWPYIFARLIGYALGYSLIALAIITLVRNLVAGIVALFILPTLDTIAGALLSTQDIESTKVLPFSALGRISNISGNEGFSPEFLPATVVGATAVAGIYILGLWAVSWYLFIKRDAI